MSLLELFSDFIQHLHSPDRHQLARHADHPGAFTRRRKMPLPSLIALMLCGMSKSDQAELDLFFGHLRRQAQLMCHASEQAFAQARAKLSQHAIPALNDYLIAQACQNSGRHDQNRTSSWHRIHAKRGALSLGGLGIGPVSQVVLASAVYIAIYEVRDVHFVGRYHPIF